MGLEKSITNHAAFATKTSYTENSVWILPVGWADADRSAIGPYLDFADAANLEAVQPRLLGG